MYHIFFQKFLSKKLGCAACKELNLISREQMYLGIADQVISSCEKLRPIRPEVSEIVIVFADQQIQKSFEQRASWIELQKGGVGLRIELDFWSPRPNYMFVAFPLAPPCSYLLHHFHLLSVQISWNELYFWELRERLLHNQNVLIAIKASKLP